MPHVYKQGSLLVYKGECYKEKIAEYEDWRCNDCSFFVPIIMECDIEKDSVRDIGTMCPSHKRRGYYVKGVPKGGI